MHLLVLLLGTFYYIPRNIETVCMIPLIQSSQNYFDIGGKLLDGHYALIEVEVKQSGIYGISSNSTMQTSGYIYEDSFDGFSSVDDFFSMSSWICINSQFRSTVFFQTETTYIILLINTVPYKKSKFSIIVSGPNQVTLTRLNTSTIVELVYSSALTPNSSRYVRNGCGLPNDYYEAIQLEILQTGFYEFIINSTSPILIRIYDEPFIPFNPPRDFLDRSGGWNTDGQYRLISYLETNVTNIMIVKTDFPNVTGTFSIFVSKPKDIRFIRINNNSAVVQTIYSSVLTTNSEIYARTGCPSLHYYETIELNVPKDGIYSFSSNSSFDAYGYLYQNYFNPFDLAKNYLSSDYKRCSQTQFKIVRYLLSNTTYVLVVTTFHPNRTGHFAVFASGLHKATLNHINKLQIYSSALTADSQIYSRECGKSNYYYETIQVIVDESGIHSFASRSSISTYGYIYNGSFNPFNPNENLLLQDGYDCIAYKVQLTVFLRVNITYILVVTTTVSNIQGKFTVYAIGPNNVSLNRLIESHSTCAIGDWCHSYTRSIGLTLDDILREQIQPSIGFTKQPSIVKMSTALTMIMFVGGLVNSVLSLLTFRNEDLRKVGCGMYLLASSITSLITICLFTVKFWFVVLTQMKLYTSLSVLQGGCMSIEPLLKLSVYLDGWLNACVAIERTVNVAKGVRFDKNKSKRIARWVILILPFFVMGTIIHEPIHRDLFKYQTEIYIPPEYKTGANESEEYTMDANNTTEYEWWTNKSLEYAIGRNEPRKNQTETNFWCITQYSLSVQNYNTAVLFFHLIVPFIANLFSAIFIILKAARQKSVAQTKRAYKEHVLEQLSEHKQLLISPIILLILALPRLIISLLSGCVNASNNVWLYLLGYYISFIPSMLMFIVFVLPSDLYLKTFQQSLPNCRQQTSR